MRDRKLIETEIERNLAEERRARERWMKWDRRREELRRERVALGRELQATSYPPETIAPAVTFQKAYGSASGKRYTFAAVKGDGRWWLTGIRSPQGLTWQQLWDFARQDNALTMVALKPLWEETVPF